MYSYAESFDQHFPNLYRRKDLSEIVGKQLKCFSNDKAAYSLSKQVNIKISTLKCLRQ